MAISPRPVTGDARRWKAMSHPLRREMLRHLGEHGTASSTTLAEALGESTGTTSYHLRVLADAGVIEEVPGQTNGRERWWRTVSVDLREPDYDSLSEQDRAALDEWRAGGYYTAEDLDAFFNEYMALLRKYGHAAEDAPPGARPMQLRMFYLPDESAEPEEPANPE
jgi:DNA-binding transcriptional ArsR family regulator